MQQIDRNMTQVEDPETRQTKLSLKVINLSSHRLHVKFEHQLQSQSPRCSSLSVVHVVAAVVFVLVRLHVDVYICLLSLRALYCFIMSLGVFIVSMSLSLDVVAPVSVVVVVAVSST